MNKRVGYITLNSQGDSKIPQSSARAGQVPVLGGYPSAPALTQLYRPSGLPLLQTIATEVPKPKFKNQKETPSPAEEREGFDGVATAEKRQESVTTTTTGMRTRTPGITTPARPQHASEGD